MAGGGIKGGISVGETDEFSCNAVSQPVHLNDLNATIMHSMGIGQSRFSYKFQGLDARLTGVEAVRIIREILA